MRRLAPAFVVTISTVAACAGSKPPTSSTTEIAKPNPTSDEPSRAPEPTPSEPEPVEAAPRLDDYPNVLNAKDSAGRAIFRAESGPGCYVELPFGPLNPGEQRPPGTAPPRQKLTCPAVMKDPAYDACLGGTIHAKSDRTACICFVMGNPPEVPRAIGCPGK